MPSAARARRIRKERAAALDRLRRGHGVRRVFESVPDGYSGIPVHVILTACPGIGPVTTRAVLERAKVWPLEPLGSLTRDERFTVLEVLPDHIQ